MLCVGLNFEFSRRALDLSETECNTYGTSGSDGRTLAPGHPSSYHPLGWCGMSFVYVVLLFINE